MGYSLNEKYIYGLFCFWWCTVVYGSPVLRLVLRSKNHCYHMFGWMWSGHHHLYSPSSYTRIFQACQIGRNPPKMTIWKLLSFVLRWLGGDYDWHIVCLSPNTCFVVSSETIVSGCIISIMYALFVYLCMSLYTYSSCMVRQQLCQWHSLICRYGVTFLLVTFSR